MLFNQMCLIPAAIVVIIFLFMTKRAKLKKGCLDGRPGIQVPVDFLGEEKNRFSYVAGYGAMAIAVANMFLSSKGSDMSIVTVICIGTIYLPFFMCLSTDAKLLGAVFGALYTLMRKNVTSQWVVTTWIMLKRFYRECLKCRCTD
ncbi:hypothetical protein AC249_AIPGENE10335 [Exaiptasia diaphana]|nr:hypothetical protein AC249_AIPGENE10335 [Exaiptasia diaphana]